MNDEMAYAISKKRFDYHVGNVRGVEGCTNTKGGDGNT
jgi:hypothetical protein